MELKRNWWEVVKYAWSIRFIMLSIFLNSLAAAITYFEGVLPIENWQFAVLVATVNFGALVSRLIPQKNLPDE